MPRQHGKEGVREAVLPVRERPNVKYVAMARNGLEVVRSWNPFSNEHRAELLALWGGFPPRLPEDDITESFQTWLPGNAMGALWWEYVACWWAFRNDPNVKTLHRENPTL
ncbi:hypothetical protein T484DRAFT_2161573 [Baffinella frigidus]|nr:hypothetical protein T484DRAFT_2161573 [Cryptophyta sp. CCMP2293]